MKSLRTGNRKNMKLIGMLKRLSLLCMLLMLSMAAFAQDIKVTAAVKENNVTMNDRIIYQITVSGSVQNLPLPKMPDFKGFKAQIIDSRNMSTNIVNGAITVSKFYQAILYPTAEGKFEIPPATVEYNGNTIQSNTITINVGKEPVSDVPAIDINGTEVLSAQTDDKKINEQLKNKLFLLPQINNKKPYVGEPITIDYYIYNQNLALASGPAMQAIPEFKNFVKEITSKPEDWQKTAEEKVINGKQFVVYKLMGFALIPITPGKVTIEPFDLGVKLRTQGSSRRSGFRDPFGNDPFDDFFGGGAIDARLPIAPVEIDVRELPEKEKPANFSGTVGNYGIESKIDRDKVKEGDVVTLDVTFRGEGNIDSIQEPKLPDLQDFELYDTQKSGKSNLDGKTIVGEKKFEFILKTKKAGQCTIPEITYSIFNPKKEQYENLKTKQFTVQVDQAEQIKSPLVVSAPVMQQGTTSSPDGKLIESTNEINYIKKSAAEYSGYSILFRSPVFLLIQLIPLLILGIAFYISREMEVRLSDIASVRKRKAKGEAAKRLKTAKAFLKEDNDKFFVELSKSLTGFLADHFNLPAAGMTYDQIRERLEEKNIEENLLNKTLKLLEDSDAMRYSPGKPDDATREQFILKASEVINELSNSLK